MVNNLKFSTAYLTNQSFSTQMIKNFATIQKETLINEFKKNYA